MRIFILEEVWWDDADGYSHKLLDAYYDHDHAITERDLMIEQYAFDYESHKRNYRVLGVILK
jgi:hypothetical protein